jgi:hypothetical protein
MLNVIYSECQKQPFMLNVIMLRVIIMSVLVPLDLLLTRELDLDPLLKLLLLFLRLNFNLEQLMEIYEQLIFSDS